MSDWDVGERSWSMSCRVYCYQLKLPWGKMKVLAVLVLVAAVLEVAAGQNDEERQYLIAHNNARQAEGVFINPLRWNTQLSFTATNWARDRASNANCALKHSGWEYGENIYWSGGPSSPADAVNLWVDEKQWYDYYSNSCAQGKVCGHYTQVVWRDTYWLGCGSARCPDGGNFVVCNYWPPGNYEGQRPYLQSDMSTIPEVPIPVKTVSEGVREEA